MEYRFKCTQCSKVEVWDLSIKDPFPENVVCKNCGEGIMKYDFAKEIKSKSVRIPHNFIAK